MWLFVFKVTFYIKNVEIDDILFNMMKASLFQCVRYKKRDTWNLDIK